MRAVAFSDPRVIAEINQHFVPLEINITDQGFPAELSGLKWWKAAYDRNLGFHFGFATSVVLGPDGSAVFGTSGSGYRSQMDTAVNYDGKRFLDYLIGCRERFEQARELSARGDREGLERLRAAIVQQLREANSAQPDR